MSSFGERSQALFKSFVKHPIATTGSTLTNVTGIKAFSKYTGGDKNNSIPDSQRR